MKLFERIVARWSVESPRNESEDVPVEYIISHIYDGKIIRTFVTHELVVASKVNVIEMVRQRHRTSLNAEGVPLMTQDDADLAANGVDPELLKAN